MKPTQINDGYSEYELLARVHSLEERLIMIEEALTMALRELRMLRNKVDPDE